MTEDFPTPVGPRKSNLATGWTAGVGLERIALSRDCIDFNSGTVTIRQSYCAQTGEIVQTTKGGRVRIVGMSESLQQTLQDHLNSHQHKLVFSDINGAVLSENHMRWMFNKDVRAAGIKKIRFHDIRHTYASHFVMKGGSLYDLMGILGHANIETTMRYAHLSPDHLRSKASIVTFASDAQTAKAPNIFQISEERQKRIRIVKPHKIEVQSL